MGISLKKYLARQSLIHILTVPFVLQVAIAVSTVGFISFRNGQQAVNDVAKRLRQETTLRIAERLHSFAEIPHAINAINGGALRRREIDPTNSTRGKDIFLNQMTFYTQISFIYCGLEANGEVLGVVRVGDEGALRMGVGNITTGFRNTFFHLTPTGELGSQVDGVPRRFDSRLRPWYRAAVRDRTATWSEIYLDFSTLLPTITASLPVFDNNQNLIGVCAVDYFLPQEMSNFLSELEIGKTGIAFIVERTGKLVATSTPEPMTRGTGEQTERLLAADSANNRIAGITQNLNTKFQDLERIQEGKKLEVVVAGNSYLVQVQPFRNRLNLDWLIVSVIPEADFMAQIQQNLINTIWVSGITLILVVGLGIITARWLSGLLLQLAIAANGMAQGELDQNVEIDGTREIHLLESAFNRMAEQLKVAFHQLEERVRERTQDLETANREISMLTKKLQAENLRLSAELAITQRIQQMILPKNTELLDIAELDIAGYMQPANEVGGDYYDVLNTDGIITVAIGDVTGHGLESSILMLMIQTAVRTLREHRETDLVHFLRTINRTIYKNVVRMDSEKNLTLAILNYTQGKLVLSGQHEEIIVVRANGAVQLIDTIDLGFPIGLELEIADFIDQQEIALGPGDGVVLYTDGVTEAENPQKYQYGLENLCSVLRKNWHLSAQGIIDAITKNLHSFIGGQVIHDDITVVVLKQK